MRARVARRAARGPQSGRSQRCPPNRSLPRQPSSTADASCAARRVLLNESHHDLTVDVPIAMDAPPEAIKETAQTLERVQKIIHDAMHAH